MSVDYNTRQLLINTLDDLFRRAERKRCLPKTQMTGLPSIKTLVIFDLNLPHVWPIFHILPSHLSTNDLPQLTTSCMYTLITFLSIPYGYPEDDTDLAVSMKGRERRLLTPSDPHQTVSDGMRLTCVKPDTEKPSIGRLRMKDRGSQSRYQA